MNEALIPILLNPAAGRGRAGRRAESIVRIMQSCGIQSSLVMSEGVGDLERLASEFAASGAKQIVVAGGDGSIHEAVNGILKVRGNTALGIIPIGTGNDFAKASATPLDWKEAAFTLATRLRDGASQRTIDAGRMNDRFFANGVGIGFDAKINRIAMKYKWPIGDLVYLFAVFEGMWDGVITPNVEMTFDNARHVGPITLANISNGPWVGGMFHIAPMARIDDGHLDLVYAKPVTRRRVLALLPKLIKGTHIGSPDICTERIRTFKLVADAPVPSHLDGEAQPLQRLFEIEILDQALTLL
ncbi:MAG: YegS/Rv2252/BmrU family lipid kinase [Proteobacteria bacterium]|nr:YegS/Rv2252/BmrU family lipid kinase [Pseudomonadota bacterium]MDA0994305.1 YegS/Rv2252/BmrU family lipid kinase [Pseudomonadota bacterium]